MNNENLERLSDILFIEKMKDFATLKPLFHSSCIEYAKWFSSGFFSRCVPSLFDVKRNKNITCAPRSYIMCNQKEGIIDAALEEYQNFFIESLENYKEYRKTKEFKKYKKDIENDNFTYPYIDNDPDTEECIYKEIVLQAISRGCEETLTCRKLIKEKNYKDAMFCLCDIMNTIMLIQENNMLMPCLARLKADESRTKGKQSQKVKYGEEIAGYIRETQENPKEAPRYSKTYAYKKFKNNHGIYSSKTLKSYLDAYLKTKNE